MGGESIFHYEYLHEFEAEIGAEPIYIQKIENPASLPCPCNLFYIVPITNKILILLVPFSDLLNTLTSRFTWSEYVNSYIILFLID